MPRVCVIPGEDAGAEAVEATVDLLDKLNTGIAWTRCQGVAEPGEGGRPVLSAQARAAIDACQATLFGATAGPAAPALFYLRWGKQTFANLRPTRWTPGLSSPLARPEGVDFVIVRENLEDAYLFLEGDLAKLAPLGMVSRTTGRAPQDMGPGAFALKAITREGSERVLRFGFELAKRRRAQGRPGRLTASVVSGHQPCLTTVGPGRGETSRAKSP
jgi:3-isopropylmalate dehydrogenase